MDNFIRSLPKLPTSSEMGQWDKAAIDFGIPENMLMENASRGALEAAKRVYGPLFGKTFCLFMGGGNNGGDAACLARQMIDEGARAAIYCVKEKSELKGAAAWHLDLAIKNGAGFQTLAGAMPASEFIAQFNAATGAMPDFLVDGLLGTGFARQLRPDMASLIEMINAVSKLAAAPVIALDIPSGLNSETGAPSPVAVRAAVTVTMAAAKPGLLLPQAWPFTGAIFRAPIGIPAAVKPDLPATWRLIDGECLELGPAWPENSFKNIFGHVLVFGGASGYSGAAHLACAAALRAGAGLVTACAPEACLFAIKADWPEIMTCAVAPGASWPAAISSDLSALIKKSTCLVIGPGMGRDKGAALFLSALLNLPDRPRAIIDADALALIAQNNELLALLRECDILTPHPGEAGQLLGATGRQIQMNRQKALDKLCQLSKAAVVLKGAATIAGHADMRLLCPYDIPGLAIGGAGDVLAGCLGALAGSSLYSDFSTLSLAGYGIALHAMAALCLQKKYNGRGFLATGLANALPEAPAFVAAQKKPWPDILPWPR